MMLTRLNLGRSGGVMSSQVAPPSLVMLTFPSSDPAQIVSTSWCDGASAKIVA